MLNKIFIGALAVLAMACAGLFWYGQSKAEQAARWEKSYQDVAEQNRDWQQKLEEAQKRQAEIESISVERERRRQALAQQNISLKQHIRSLSHEKPKVRSYLDNPIPVDLLDSLQQYTATDGSTQDGETVPTSPLALTVPGSLDHGTED